MDKAIDAKFSNFHCCTEWHLAKVRLICAPIYTFAFRISAKSGKFNCSAESVAEFLEVDRRTVQRAFRELRDLGFFELIESGKRFFEPSVFRVLSHKQWAERYPGRCTEKIAYPWTQEGDSLGKALWVASGSQVQFLAFQISAIRNTGIPESEIVSLFNSWYPAHKADKNGKKWRRGVSFHFLMYLREKTKGARSVVMEQENTACPAP